MFKEAKKPGLTVFELWRAKRSEVRKLEENPEHELDDVLFEFYAEIRKQNGCYIINR